MVRLFAPLMLVLMLGVYARLHRWQRVCFAVVGTAFIFVIGPRLWP